jgi:RND family efflux transporter MFP subunit
LSSLHEPPPGPHLRPSSRLKLVGLIGLAVAAVIVIVGLLGRLAADRATSDFTRQQAIPTVAVVRPESGAAASTLVLPGAIQPFFDAQIHARVNGYLKAWYTDIGARVKAGQLLALIDTPDLDQQLVRAQADLATAQANQRLAAITSQRWAGLLAKDAVSHQEADEKAGDLAAKTSITNAARAAVEQLRAEEGFKRIVAPFDGVVTARNTDIGALIAAGAPTDAPLFTVSKIDRLRIYVSVPQDQSAKVMAGMTAMLAVPEYPGRTFKAQVTNLAGAVGGRTGAVEVELQIVNPAGELKPGDYAQVTFDLPAAQGALSIPVSAALFRPKGMAVAVVGPGDRVVMKYVTVARDLGSRLDIAAGLSPGDRVIDNPPDSLGQGDLVRVAGGA